MFFILFLFPLSDIGGSIPIDPRVVIRASGDFTSDVVAKHIEDGLISATEYRPFWIELKDGVVTVGKGGQETGFLEWDAGAYHHQVYAQAYIGVASYVSAPGKWMLYLPSE